MHAHDLAIVAEGSGDLQGTLEKSKVCCKERTWNKLERERERQREREIERQRETVENKD